MKGCIHITYLYNIDLCEIIIVIIYFVSSSIPNQARPVNFFVLMTAGSEKTVLMKINFMLINKKLFFLDEKNIS